MKRIMRVATFAAGPTKSVGSMGMNLDGRSIKSVATFNGAGCSRRRATFVCRSVSRPVSTQSKRLTDALFDNRLAILVLEAHYPSASHRDGREGDLKHGVNIGIL